MSRRPPADDSTTTPPGRLRLLGISGSLRRASTNTALLRAARELAPADVEVVLHPLHDIPLYDGDLEARDGFPEAVISLREAIAAADGLLLATPEYNWSVSGVMKNAIDWASRAPEPPLDHLPAALLSGSGGSGGVRAQRHLREILRHNEVDVIDAAVRVPRSTEHVADGRLVTQEHRDAVALTVAALRDRVREAARDSEAA